MPYLHAALFLELSLWAHLELYAASTRKRCGSLPLPKPLPAAAAVSTESLTLTLALALILILNFLLASGCRPHCYEL